MKKLRKEGKFAIVKYDRLITRNFKSGEVAASGSRQGGIKRALSSTPGEIHNKWHNLDDINIINYFSIKSNFKMDVVDPVNDGEEPLISMENRTQSVLTEPHITDFFQRKKKTNLGVSHARGYPKSIFLEC